MTERKLYGVGFGPYLYDDTDAIADPDGDFSGLLEHASVSDGGHLCAFMDLLDTNQTHALKVYWNENDTAARALALLVVGGDRSLTIEGTSLINQDLTSDAIPAFDQTLITSAPTVNTHVVRLGDLLDGLGGYNTVCHNDQVVCLNDEVVTV